LPALIARLSRPNAMTSAAEEQHTKLDYHISFNANWISREGRLVALITP